MTSYIIDNSWVSLEKLEQILNSKCEVILGEGTKEVIKKWRPFLDDKIKRHDKLIYGINTGFGSLCNTAISNDDLEQLQRNLVISHACGAGEEVPQEIVRRMLLLKVLGLSHGHSGVQLETVERLLFFYNNSILY